MATKSFFKNIVIKDKKSALNFLSALENAFNKYIHLCVHNLKKPCRQLIFCYHLLFVIILQNIILILNLILKINYE